MALLSVFPIPFLADAPVAQWLALRAYSRFRRWLCQSHGRVRNATVVGSNPSWSICPFFSRTATIVFVVPITTDAVGCKGPGPCLVFGYLQYATIIVQAPCSILARGSASSPLLPPAHAKPTSQILNQLLTTKTSSFLGKKPCRPKSDTTWSRACPSWTISSRRGSSSAKKSP